MWLMALKYTMDSDLRGAARPPAIRRTPLSYNLGERENMRSRYLIALFTIAFTLAAVAQQPQPQAQEQTQQKPPEDKSKRPSPPGTAEVTLKGKKITIDYSRPYLKGRHVGQELAPFGQVWRTGANEATTFVTEGDVKVGDVNVPAGNYTLFTLPSEGTWKLIINKQTGQWGTRYDESQDLARIDLQKSQLPRPVEQFTISFNKKSADSADLVLEWENLRLSVPLKAK